MTDRKHLPRAPRTSKSMKAIAPRKTPRLSAVTLDRSREPEIFSPALGLHYYTAFALRRAGFYTVEDIETAPDIVLLSVRGIGEDVLRYVRSQVEAYRLLQMTAHEAYNAAGRHLVSVC